MATRLNGENLRWYRCQVSKADMAMLNQKSDLKGALWTLGYLGLLAATGTAAFLACGRLPWYAVVGLVLLHGMCWNFLINGFHELIHDSVFRTKSLNERFLWVFSFLGQHNHVAFWASHTEHHKFTLHPPDDQEVVLPVKLRLKDFLYGAVVNYHGLRWALTNHVRIARNRLEGSWEHHLFDNHPEERRRLVRWSRFILASQAVIIIASLVLDRVLPGHHLWMLPVLITLAPYYGGALHYLCNNAQHVGLRDSVPDFRLCCRTIYLNPVFRFLYWNMNYHTEHHMFAAVPCYNLGRLHRLIKEEMPPCPDGLYQTWKGIVEILRRQQADPAYQFTAVLPPPAGAASGTTAAPGEQDAGPAAGSALQGKDQVQVVR